jgi:hypothetical protein
VVGLLHDDPAGRGRHAFYQTADPRGLGPALRWAVNNAADSLDVLVEAPAAPTVARRAELLDPAAVGLTLRVWSASGPEVEPASAGPLEPAPPLGSDYDRFRELIASVGALPVDDHGMLVAEIDGLEVARVVTGGPGEANNGGAISGVGAVETVNTNGETGGLYLSVGVGQADRELQSYVHGHLDDATNLARAIDAVRQHRNPESPSHPLSRLARQRWLRSVAVADPASLGLDRLETVPPLAPRETLLGTEPSAALGHGPAGPAVVVCSVGVDLDLLPEAADYRSRDASEEAELIVVVPQRDRDLAVGRLAPIVPGLRLESPPLPWG